MRVTPIGPAEPAADAAAEDPADVAALEAPGVLVHAAATTARPAVRTSPRNLTARFLDWFMRGFLQAFRNVDNVVYGL
jgi:hypothetical protein